MREFLISRDLLLAVAFITPINVSGAEGGAKQCPNISNQILKRIELQKQLEKQKLMIENSRKLVCQQGP